jgi:50S ribosomal protein L16 3-hydroxylase
VQASHNAGMKANPTPRAGRTSDATKRSTAGSKVTAAAKKATSRKEAAPDVQVGPAGIDILQATPLLGGISPEQFMRRYWQKKPLLIRQAVPGVQSPIERARLFELAGQDDVESRLIIQQAAAGPGKPSTKAATKSSAAVTKASARSTNKKASQAGWAMQHGPFARRDLPALSQAGWTLLVQGLDLHVPAAYELLQRFRFVPDARLDDLMISYATDGGGVGPHFDSYDVFLLQVHGQRRWRIGPLKDASLQEDVPLKILSNFVPEQEWVLEPGDMLYLPPRWAHDGIAQGECMTCSIGFRVPEETELAREVLLRWIEGLECPEKPQLYKDPKQPATTTPGLVPAALHEFAAAAVAQALKDPHALSSALGEVLTEPKPRVWFQAGEPLPDGVGLALDPRTRMVYDERCVFANGESWRVAGKDAQHMRQLADQRSLDARTVAKVSDDLRELLNQWCEDGWLHPAA